MILFEETRRSGMDTTKKLPDALRINRNRCILAIIMCSLISILVYLAITDKVLSEPNQLVKEVGWKSYHMFTILSNLLMAVISAMCIPFAVDGMRYRNYHLPRWYVNLLYAGTTGVSITFIIALTVLSPAAGFYRIMLYSDNLFLHLICPVLSILLFLFVNSDHRVSWKDSLIAIIPVCIYMVAYLILVFVVGEEAGGWRDHYQVYRILEYIPLPLLIILFPFICFAIASVLRIAHNAIHNRRKADFERYYQEAEGFSYLDIEKAIKALADIDRRADKGGDLTVPRRIIEMMEKKYCSGLSPNELCRIYIDEYYLPDQDAMTKPGR